MTDEPLNTQIAKFEEAIARAEADGPGPDVHPKVHEAMIAGMRSQLADLYAERDTPTTDAVTADDIINCGICGHKSSIAMIFTHLANEHRIYISAADLANAEIIDMTKEDDERP